MSDNRFVASAVSGTFGILLLTLSYSHILQDNTQKYGAYVISVGLILFSSYALGTWRGHL